MENHLFLYQNFIRDLDLFKNSLSKAVCDTYALESMIYLTAGIIDGYENADVDLETAIIKVCQYVGRNIELRGRTNFMDE